MRTAIFLVFIALDYIGDAIITASGKPVEPTPEIVINFLGAVFIIFMIMDIIDFITKKRE
jgi:hypothetical protein